MEKIGLYAGSFDPFTNGHLAIVCKALLGFDKLFIGVGANPDKKTLFTASERVEIIKVSIQDFIDSYDYRFLNNIKFSDIEIAAIKRFKADNNIISVISYEGLTVDCGLRIGATCLVRGERIVGDHDSEMYLSMMNTALMNIRHRHLEMISISVPREDLTYVSSSAAKSLCESGEYIAAEHYVSVTTHHLMMAKYLQEPFSELPSIFMPINDKNYEDLLLAYGQNRFHHNLSHIGYCLNYANIYQSIGNEVPKMDDLILAIFYHDFVNLGLDDDEEQTILEMNLYSINNRYANDLILATKHLDSRVLVQLEAKLISDVDLAILGDEDRYGLYAQGIRKEYAQFDDYTYAQGRIGVLEKLLSNKKLYNLSYFSEIFTETSRYNMERELTYWKNL